MSALAQWSERLTPARGPARIGPIGLHFAEEQVYAVQIRRSKGGTLCLRAWAALPYTEDRADLLGNPSRMKSLLRSLLGRSRFRGRKVVTAMPPEQLKITSLTYQANPGVADAEQIIRLVADRLEGPIADYVVDYLPVRSQAPETERVALVATCRREDVTAILESLGHAGIEVDAMEISPAAINRLIGAIPGASATKNVLVVNFGAERTYLTVVSGRRLLLDQEVEFGERALLEQIARALDISTILAGELVIRQGLTHGEPHGEASATLEGDDDFNPVVEIVKPAFARLVEEIRRACRYAASESQGNPVERVYTFGSIARWPGTSELLSRMAGIAVADTIPLAAVFDAADAERSGEYDGIGPELAVATGLALRGMTNDE